MKASREWAFWFGALLVSLGAGAPHAAAQVQGLPVYNSGVPGGIAIYADVDFPDENAGKGTAYGVSGRFGFGALGATASLSTFDPDGSGTSEGRLGPTPNSQL